MCRGWKTYENRTLMQAASVPCDEAKKHDLFSSQCRCNVRTDYYDKGGKVFRHQAFDHREFEEYLKARSKTDTGNV